MSKSISNCSCLATGKRMLGIDSDPGPGGTTTTTSTTTTTTTTTTPTTTTTTTTPQAFTPSDVPGLVAEFYSEFIVKDGADLVSQWTDQSGQGNHATQGTEDNKPLWVDAQLNGYPSIRFAGTNDWLSSALAQAFPVHIFMVVKQISWA